MYLGCLLCQKVQQNLLSKTSDHVESNDDNSPVIVAVLGLDSTSAPMSGGHEQEEFCFAFNDSKFSDRVLRIEIVSDHPETRPEPEGCQTLDDCTARKSKRRRGDILTRDDAAANSGESNCSEDCLRVLRVKTLHISSPILAAKSPFFYKLFSNGMMESEQKQVTLRINDSEEPVFMELLNFMYSNTFTSNTEPALLDLLMAADKFEVTSCMKRCICSLKDLPMTVESALRYLDLPFSVLMVDEVQHLTDAAKQFLVVQYKDISKCQDEVMNMPLVGIEAILSSDDLQVDSEDAVYKFALRWTKANYQKPEERREILSTRLGQCIRFPYMSCRKLKKILSCNDFDHEFATKSVLDALFFKAEGPLGQRSHAIEESTSTSRCFVERAYTCRPVKIVEFKLPHQKCVVYLDLKREQCANLFPCRRVCSQAFHFAGKRFFLSAECNGDHRGSCHFFGLYLWMQEKGSGTFCVEYEFSARSKPTEKYVRKDKGIYTFTEGKGRGSRNLFWDTWTSFMAEDSVYFINGVLDLQVELTIKQGFKL